MGWSFLVRRSARGSAPCAALLPALALGGCLAPAPIEVEAVLPNYPPVFPPERVTPPFEQEISYDPTVTTAPIEFEVAGITDVDAADRVYWRWFVNYDARFNPYVAAVGVPGGRAQEPGGTSIRFSLDPCEELRNLSERSLHRVEVLVSDRPFDEDDEDTVARNQSVAKGAGQFRVVWFVSVDLSACPVTL
jgi:hypothetical protein